MELLSEKTIKNHLNNKFVQNMRHTIIIKIVIFGLNELETNPATVSYTHLDVYKRQL